MSDPITLAYIAGIIDADGCVLVVRTKAYACQQRTTPGYHAKVQVRMVEDAAIDVIVETFGGHSWRARPSAPRGRPLRCWAVSDAAAQRVLEALLPYLRVKREQAENALALRRLRATSRAHRTKVVGHKVMTGQYGQRITVPVTCLSDEFVAACHALYDRSRELNRVGVDREGVMP